MKMAVRRQNARFRPRRVTAVARCDDPARLFDKQSSGGEIPWGEFELEEAVEAAKSDPAEIERRGPEAADSVDLATE